MADLRNGVLRVLPLPVRLRIRKEVRQAQREMESESRRCLLSEGCREPEFRPGARLRAVGMTRRRSRRRQGGPDDSMCREVAEVSVAGGNHLLGFRQ